MKQQSNKNFNNFKYEVSMSFTTEITQFNPDWYATVSAFSYTDIRPHPSTRDVGSFFTRDIQFYSKPDGRPFGIEAFYLTFPLFCQADVKAIGEQTITFKQMPGTNESEGYVEWTFSGQQLRNGFGVPDGKGWYHMQQTAELYLRDDNGKTLIHKYVITATKIIKLTTPPTECEAESALETSRLSAPASVI